MMIVLIALLFLLVIVTSAQGALIADLLKENRTMSPAFQALATQVERSTTVTESVVTLVKGLAAQIEASKDDPAAISKLAETLSSNLDALASQVTANTAPPAPAPAPAAPAAEPPTEAPPT